jgi:hypothetical protein
MPTPTLFSRSLGRVRGAVEETFTSDAALAQWIQAINSPQPDPYRYRAELERLTQRLRSGWIFALLDNEEKSEELGIVNEAIVVSARAFSHTPVTRQRFAYAIANTILNKGIRKINDTARKMGISLSDEPLIHECVDPLRVSDIDNDRTFKILLSTFENQQRALDGIKGKALVDVMKAWSEAIRTVEGRGPASSATPHSSAVREEVASMTGLDVKTVEAIMKRITRAVKKNRSA